jgi:hypothetical protein
MSFFGTNTVASRWGWQNRWVQTGDWELPTEIQKLMVSSNGVDISSDGNTAVVASGNGGAYVFVNNGGAWTQQAQLVDKCLSATISGNGNILVVGDSSFEVGGIRIGRAIKYTRTGTTWSAGTVLPTSSAPAGWVLDGYGTEISISDNGQFLIISAPVSINPQGNFGGITFVYNLNTLSYLTYPGVSTTNPYEATGRCVDISDDGKTFIFGSFEPLANLKIYTTSTSIPNNITSANLTGTTWTNDMDAEACSLSADGNLVAIGSTGSGSGNSGSVFIYGRSNASSYTQLQQISPPVSPLRDFGGAVSLSNTGNVLYVGSNGTSLGTIGKVYVYENTGNGWQIQGNLTASDGAANNFFGRFTSTSGDGNTIIISGTGTNGGAYIFGQ